MLLALLDWDQLFGLRSAQTGHQPAIRILIFLLYMREVSHRILDSR